MLYYKIKAKYPISQEEREQLDPMYRHNPFIETLPAMLDKNELAVRIRKTPAYEEAERNKPIIARLQAIRRIKNCVFPLQYHFNLYYKLYNMLCSGYMGRNKLHSAWIKQMNSAFTNIDWSNFDEGNLPYINSSADGFAIIGTSGIGKTTAMKTILSLFPQIIEHSFYNGEVFKETQITWIKLECPHDGSLRALCMDFFQQLDKILGDDKHQQYYAANTRLSAENMIPIMARATTHYNIGALIIDEIQNLSEAKSGGKEKMLNFFTKLINSLSMPVILMGTHKAKSLFSNFAIGRRNTGQDGSLVLSNFDIKDAVEKAEWDRFLKRLWKYQFLKEHTELTPEIEAAFYHETQGIIDIAVKLYMVVQYEIIGRKKEIITPEAIHKAASKHFKLIQNMLTALRKGDLLKLEEIGDLIPSEILIKLQKQINQDMEKKVLNSITNNDDIVKEESLHEKLYKHLTLDGYNGDNLQNAINIIIHENPHETNIYNLLEKIRILLQTEGL